MSKMGKILIFSPFCDFGGFEGWNVPRGTFKHTHKIFYIRFAIENAKIFLKPHFFKILAHSFMVDAVVITSSTITIF